MLRFRKFSHSTHFARVDMSKVSPSLPPSYSPIEMLERLIAFDTTSHLSNLDLIEHVSDYLRRHGVESLLSYNPQRSKANLFATLPAASGETHADGVVLSGHTDVVPVKGQSWDSDPFNLQRSGERLYGRGTSDMKGFLACALALVPELLASRPSRPIHLALSYDEELGCLGVGGMIDQVQAEGYRPTAAIIGEPTGMKLLNAHKGIYAFRTSVTGQAAHSSAPQLGANAIQATTRLINHLTELEREQKRSAPAGSRFDPPQTTFNISIIHGGTAINIIPEHCELTWEFRPIPQTDPEELIASYERFAEREVLPVLRTTAPHAAITTERLCCVPYLREDQGSPAEELIASLIREPASGYAAFATEGGVFQKAGIPAAVCGPGHIDQAHQPNEFIDVSQLEACCAMLRQLAN